MPRWYEGWNINHEGLMDALNNHRRNGRCDNCFVSPLENPTYLTLKLHNAWRKRTEKHLGAKLPNTILGLKNPPEPPKGKPKPPKKSPGPDDQPTLF